MRSQAPAITGYTACVWALIFAAAHIYWAIGGTVGLQGHGMTGLLFLINLVAIPLCFIAAIVAVALTESWDQTIPHWMWLTAAWGASTLLVLRGIVGIVQGLFSQNHVPLLLMAYDSWFLLGGILFSSVALVNHPE